MTNLAENKSQETTIPDMKDIVALCKRRGFIFPASDIYGRFERILGLWPFGYRVEKQYSWPVVEGDGGYTPIGPDGEPLQIVGRGQLYHSKSKGVGGLGVTWADFQTRWLIAVKQKKRYRADHLDVLIPKDGEGAWIAVPQDDETGVEAKTPEKIW